MKKNLKKIAVMMSIVLMLTMGMTPNLAMASEDFTSSGIVEVEENNNSSEILTNAETVDSNIEGEKAPDTVEIAKSAEEEEGKLEALKNSEKENSLKTENVLRSEKAPEKGIWINDDTAVTYATINEAVAKATAGDKIHIRGDFSQELDVAKAANVNKDIILDVAGNTVLAGDNGDGIILSNGAKITTGINTLSMSKFKTAIIVKANSEINDGIYMLDGNGMGFDLQGTGQIKGNKDRESVQISAKDSSGKGFGYSLDSQFINSKILVEVSKSNGEQYNLLQLTNTSLTTKGVWYYFNPQEKYVMTLDNSDFYAYKANGASAYKQVMAILGKVHLKNGSTLTGDGSRITLSEYMLVENSKVVIKNSTAGGLNINYKPAKAEFINSTLETTNLKYTPSYGTGQSYGPAHLSFTGDSVINTDNKDKTADNGGANRGTGSTYVVTGGSYLVAYDETYNYNVTTPTNGESNGNEWLSYFTLSDKSINVLNPINKSGVTYEYKVGKASKDGEKHVFTPAAKVTFKLLNGDAKFADGKTVDKKAKTIRGYKLGDVVGNTNPGTPTDKNSVKFLGWFYKEADGTEKEFKWDDTIIKDMEVYAKWEGKTLVYHNSNGVDYVVNLNKDANSEKVRDFDDIVKANSDFDVKGKVFKGWTKASNGSGTVYHSGDLLKIDADFIDLYAQYEDLTYKVAFSANGGTFADDSVFKTTPNVFEIVEEDTGGEVAVLKKEAKYGDTLRTLLNGLSHNKLKPDTKAKRPAYILSDNTYWGTKFDNSGNIRFDDYSIFGLLHYDGENPKITEDTTYYLK